MENAYKICTVQEPVAYDSVPVAKITRYPLEPRDYKPFAQAILCLSEKALHLRMWAFELSPAKSSALKCVLYPFADTHLALDITIGHGDGHQVDTRFALFRDGVVQPIDGALQDQLAAQLASKPHNGEDLQGVYWGLTLSLPLPLLDMLGGKCNLIAGQAVPGNFFKISSVPQFEHSGSCFAADFSLALSDAQNMGTFEIVSY